MKELEVLWKIKVEILKARPHDVIVFHVPLDASPRTVEHLHDMVDELTDMIDVTAAVLPSDFKVQVRNYTLTDLLQLRDELDQIIGAVASLTAQGEA